MTATKNRTALIAVRCNPEMKEWLQMRAHDGYRTMSAEILSILEKERKEFAMKNAQPVAAGQASVKQ